MEGAGDGEGDLILLSLGTLRARPARVSSGAAVRFTATLLELARVPTVRARPLSCAGTGAGGGGGGPGGGGGVEPAP